MKSYRRNAIALTARALIFGVGSHGCACAPHSDAAAAPLEAIVLPREIPDDVARAVLRSHVAEIELCFERARMDPLYLKVPVEVSALVAFDGRVAVAKTSAVREGNSRLQACIGDAVKTWGFPPPVPGKPEEVRYKFETE